MSVDTPGDLHWLNGILTGIRVECEEFRNVEVEEKELFGRIWEHILCPPGCVKSVEDVERKCGIVYWGK